MNSSAEFLAARGWALRIARVVSFTMFGMVPIHYFVPCDASAIVMGVACVLLVVAGTLSIIAHRYSPFGWAIVAILLHTLSTH
jgi:hypothetical protein